MELRRYAPFVFALTILMLLASFDTPAQQTTASWTQLLPSTSPSGRNGVSAVYDPGRDRMLVFGGFDNGTRRVTNDLWSLDLASHSWKKINPSAPLPSSRAGYLAVLDSKRDRLVIYGGSDWYHQGYNDTWQLDLKTHTWSTISTTGSPPGVQINTYGVYDPRRDCVFVFGGTWGTGTGNDTYSLNLSTRIWTKLSPSGSIPTPRSAGACVLDTKRDRMIIFGGADKNQTALPHVYALELGKNPITWTYLTSHERNAVDQAAVYDPALSLMIVVGTYVDPSAAAVFDLSTDRWLSVKASTSVPPRRYDPTAVFDPQRRRAIMFGGTNNKGFNDTWELDLSAPYPVDLGSDRDTLSVASGGMINLKVDAGPGHASRPYLMLGSVSGTSPGTLLPEGRSTLPLNLDAFSHLSLVLGNTAMFWNFQNILDGTGQSLAQCNSLGPIPPAMKGCTIHFAAALHSPWDAVSNPVGVLIVP